MSSSYDRGALHGVIRQKRQAVGAVIIPDMSEEFMEEFNDCYGPLQMKAELLDPPKMPRTVPCLRNGQSRLPFWYRSMYGESLNAAPTIQVDETTRLDAVPVQTN